MRPSARVSRRYKDFRWSTLDSWARRRRVIGKAEWTGGEANPRFVVTSLRPREIAARPLYEQVYCARGDTENRIKECQLDLFADRRPCCMDRRGRRNNSNPVWFQAIRT